MKKSIKRKGKKSPVPSPEVKKEIKKVSIKSAGIVDEQFQVVLTDDSHLEGIDEIQTKKVGYGNALYVHIFCRVDGLNTTTPSTPISEILTK